MEIVLIDTKNPKVQIEILIIGIKIGACHQKIADCDDLAVVQNWTKLRKIRLFV